LPNERDTAGYLPHLTARTERLAIAGVLVLALALRLLRLDAALWFDEIVTLLRFVRLPFAELVQTYDSLNNHMFFSLQAKLAVTVFGETAWALRLPAVIWGVAGIWALWRLAREVTWPGAAVLAALLMTLSYHHVWFSQNARGYTGLLFFGLIATLLLVRALRRPGWAVWAAYMACLVAAMYTHLSAGFFFLAHGLAWLMLTVAARARHGGLPNGAVRMPLVAAAGAALVLVLLFGPMVPQISETFGAVQQGSGSAVKSASVEEWKSPLWMLAEVSRSLGPVLGLALPAVVLVLIVSMIGFARTEPVLPLILAGHVVLTVAILVATGFRIWPRYFLVDLGLICLFLIHGSYLIGDWLAARVGALPRAAGMWLAVAGIAASLVLLPRNYAYPKQDFTGARDFVEAQRHPDAAVMALGLTAMPYLDYYAPGWVGIDDLDGFQAAYRPERENWIVYTFPGVIEKRFEDLFARYGDAFEKAAYFPGTLAEGGIVVLKSRGG